MRKSLLLIQLAFVLLLVFGLIGCVEAGSTGVSVTKANGAGFDSQIREVGQDYAKVAKYLGFTVTGNGGKFAYTASGPVSATSLDGNVTVSVDAMKLAISGKTSGTGTATANATVLASGTATSMGAEVVTVVESDIAVDVGARGSAEASASASGWADSTAAIETMDLSAYSEGATTAYGKVSSPDAYVDAEGEIIGVAHIGQVDGQYDVDPFCEVESWVEGTGTTTAKATANGASEAHLDIDEVGTWDVTAEGNTLASGTSKYTGYFDVFAEVESLADMHKGNVAWTDIWADAYTEGNDKYATATGKAVVTSGSASASALNEQDVFAAGASGDASGSSSIRGIGWADGEGEIYAESEELGDFYWWDEFEGIGYDLEIQGHLVDQTYIWDEAEVVGGAYGFVGSAAGSATGSAGASGFYEVDDYMDTAGISSTQTSGTISSSATAKNTGWAYGESSLVSVDALGSIVFLEIEYEGLEELGADIEKQLPIDLGEIILAEEPTLQQIGTMFYAPAFEASAIQQIVATGGETIKDSAEAKTFASGTTESAGTFEIDDGETVETFSADSYATGMVAGLSRANMCKDPTSTSVIVEFDTWIGEDSGVDIALVGSASYADGRCGMTEGLAVGSAGMDLKQLSTGATAYAEGMAKTYAQANDGVSLSLAGVGSGAFAGEEDESILDAMGSVVDASLVGTAALSFGANGQAAAEAAGNTSAASYFFDEREVFDSSMSTIVENGIAGSEVRVKNGIALDVAGIGSTGLVQSAQDEVGQDDYAAGASIITDIAFGNAPTKSDVAEAAGFAAGSTEATGGFIVDNLFAEPGYQEGDVSTFASGRVADAVEAAWSDPLAASMIGSVVSVNSESIGFSDTPELVVDGSMLGSIAMAEGKSAVAVGEAIGETGASGHLEHSYLGLITGEVITMDLNSTTYASGLAETAAEAKGGLALSLAGEGSLNVVAAMPYGYDVAGGSVGEARVPVIPEGPIHPILLGNLVELTPEQHDQMVANLRTEVGMAGKYLPDEILGETACEIWELIGCGKDRVTSADAAADPLLVDGSLIGAASFAVGNAEAASMVAGETDTESTLTVMDFIEGVDIEVVSLASDASAGGAIETEVLTTNGVALAAGGAGSLDIVAYDYGDEELDISPTADLIEVSLLGDIAFADSFDKKATSWSKVSVVGETDANGAFDGLFDNDGYLNETSGMAASSAEGATKGFARAYNCDPLSISVIGAISDVEADGIPNPVEFEAEDVTFIDTVSIAVGEGCGLANGGVSGEAATAHSENYNWVASGDRYQVSDSLTYGDFVSAVDVKNGMGIAASGADSGAEVEWERPSLERVSEAGAAMGAYTGGFGFTSGSVVKASSGFADAFSGASASDTRVPNGNLLLFADTHVDGSGSSSVKVLGLNGAESLAEENAWAYATEDPDSMSQTEAWFGVQLIGSDASGIVATADLSDTRVYGDAYSRNPDTTYATVSMWDGGASAVLMPKPNTAAANAWNNQWYFDASLNGGYVEGGFAAVDTINDPNTAYAFRYARAQGQDGVPLVPTPDEYIVLW